MHIKHFLEYAETLSVPSQLIISLLHIVVLPHTQYCDYVVALVIPGVTSLMDVCLM